MVTGRSTEHNVSLLNAHNIARMAGSEYQGTLTPAAENKVRQIVDEMASLHSLDHVPTQQINTARMLLDENPESIENVLLQHQIFKEDALQNNFNGKPTKMMKGYTKAVLNPRIDYIQGTLEDAAELEARGYIRQHKPLPKDPNDPEQRDLYIYKSTVGTTASFTSQILSLTNNVMRGISSRKIENIHGASGATPLTRREAALAGIKHENIMVNATWKKIDGMFKPEPPANPNDPGNYMVPTFDDKGEISELRYIMNETTKDEQLEQTNDIDAVFMKLAETAVDKAASPIINDELIVALKEMYDKDFPENPTAYVEISPYSDDAHYREIYYMIPPQARATIAREFPDGRLKVAKDVIDLAFGTRKYAFQETLEKDPKQRNLFTNSLVGVAGFALGLNPFGKSKYKDKKGRVAARTKMAETIVQQLTMLAKNNIVVRNLSVVMGNYSSNIAYLMSRGVTMEEINTRSTEAVIGAMDYEETNSKLQEMLQKRELYLRRRGVNAATKATVLKNMQRKIGQLQNELELNPVTRLIKEGMMTAIVDDIDTDLAQSNYEHGVDAVISKTMNKLPTRVQSVARTMFLTNDSKGYKSLNNAVKMTDFVGRYVLYHHYTESKNMDPEVAFRKVNEEFINFSLPTHRMIEYGNNMGAIWFSKYQLRVLKQILTSVADKPFTAISTFIVGSLIGTGNILNSIPGITKDLFMAFNNPLGMLDSSVGQIATIDAATGLFD
jgi:hypothetical protein